MRPKSRISYLPISILSMVQGQLIYANINNKDNHIHQSLYNNNKQEEMQPIQRSVKNNVDLS